MVKPESESNGATLIGTTGSTKDEQSAAVATKSSENPSEVEPYSTAGISSPTSTTQSPPKEIGGGANGEGASPWATGGQNKHQTSTTTRTSHSPEATSYDALAEKLRGKKETGAIAGIDGAAAVAYSASSQAILKPLGKRPAGSSVIPAQLRSSSTPIAILPAATTTIVSTSTTCADVSIPESASAPVTEDKGQCNIGSSSSSRGLAPTPAAPLASLSSLCQENDLLASLTPHPISEVENLNDQDPKPLSVSSQAHCEANASAAKLSAAAAALSGHPKGKAGNSLRRGKWTVEEENYVARVIQDFNSGFLNAPAGTTLRSYLSEKLQCDPMRITKKFTGDACIGKRVFHPAVRSPSNAAAIDKAQAELESLERRWRRRLEMQQRESAKKAAASAAAAAAASGRSHGFITQGAVGANLHASSASVGNTMFGGQNSGSANVVTQTASWLDRASTILKETGCSGITITHEQAQALQSLPKKEIEKQMKEVERLIHEGPLIQQTSAGLPLVLHQSIAADGQQAALIPGTVTTNDAASSCGSSDSDGQRTPPEPADKRMRTGAEDAEALVGFLTAVRASAAAGTDSFSG